MDASPPVFHAKEIWTDGEELFLNRDFMLYCGFVIISRRDENEPPFWINQKHVSSIGDVTPLGNSDPARIEALKRFRFVSK